MKGLENNTNELKVTSPTVPLCQKLPNLSDGVLVCIKGQVWPNAKKVTIRFLGPGKDVGLSIEFVYGEDEALVMRSCVKNGRLKKKDIDVFDSMPKQGDVFEVIVLVTSSVYKCSLNGNHVFDFPILLKLDSITTYSIFGDCDVARISFQMPRPIPVKRNDITTTQTPSNQIQLPAFFPMMNSHPKSPPQIGFMFSYSPPSSISPSFSDILGETHGPLAQLIFPEGVPPQRIITLYASTSPSSKWFKISFKKSDQSLDSAFTVYVNLKKGEVIRSDIIEGVVGDRETFVPYFPFTPGETFSILILCLPDVFKMAVNQSHILEFRQRTLGLKDIQCVQVEGDVLVSHFFDSAVTA